MTTEDFAQVFDPLRPRLLRVAYRMLGSVADAEDVVQEAFLRWHGADREAVREPEGFLRRVVTRLCLDVLKSAQRRREVYVGPWLPEPVVEATQGEDLDDEVTLPLMMALDRLSPLERAAFLLHDVFAVPFEEVGEIIGREPAACRQLASRARTHVRAARPRFATPRERGLQIAEVGIEDELRVHTGIAIKFAETGPSQLVRLGLVKGLPGFVTREPDGLLQTTAFLVEAGRVAAIYIMRNPEKL